MIAGFVYNIFYTDFGIVLKASVLFTIYSFIYQFVFKQLKTFTIELGKLSIIKLRFFLMQKIGDNEVLQVFLMCFL